MNNTMAMAGNLPFLLGSSGEYIPTETETQIDSATGELTMTIKFPRARAMRLWEFLEADVPLVMWLTAVPAHPAR